MGLAMGSRVIPPDDLARTDTGWAIESRFMTASSFWCGVGPVAAPGVTSAEPAGCQPGTTAGPVSRDRLNGVIRATGHISARRRPTIAGRLIEPEQKNEKVGDRADMVALGAWITIEGARGVRPMVTNRGHVAAPRRD